MSTFHLPDLGEGLADAEIREWHVKPGESVEVDQPLVSMETAKAVVEVPSPHQGEIKTLYGAPGDVIETGAPLVEFSISNSSNTVAGNIEEGHETVAETATVANTPPRSKSRTVRATPAVRALAKKLGVDLSLLQGTGPNQRITQDDVKKSVAAPALFTGGEPLKGTRRTMANVMSQAHQAVVPVSIFERVAIHQWQTKDITFRLIRAIAYAITQEPRLNAWYDGSTQIMKQFTALHLGIATDSDEGLIVPVLHDIDQHSQDPEQLRLKVNQLKDAVKTRSIAADALKGATFTLSNFGMFAGLFATPIVVPPQVAILGAGRIHPHIYPDMESNGDGKMLPLSLTFDHRAITGGEATRFLAAIRADLEKIN